MGKRANGEGTISKRKDGRWCARITVHTPQGLKRKAFYGKSRKEAGDKMLAAMGQPPTQEQSAMRVSEWLDSWLISARPGIGAHTFERYSQVVGHNLRPAVGAMRLRDLRPMHVEDLRDEMLADSAPATVKYALGVLSTAMGRAVSRGLIDRNPVSVVKRPKDRNVKMRPTTATQCARLLYVAGGRARRRYYATRRP